MAELEQLLELYELEELFEVLDVTPIQVLTILFEGGHIAIPDFLEKYDVEEGQEG